MTSCDSQFSHVLIFLYRHLHSQSSSSSSSYALDSSICDAETRKMLKNYADQEINLLLWFALIGITAFLVKKCVFLIKIWDYGRRIPGPPSPSFYGHSKLFSRDTPQDDLTELLAKSHEKYGSMVKLWLSPTQLLVSVKDPSLINDMLLKAADKLPLIGRVYRLAFGQSRFFVSSFEKVKRGRQTLAVELNGKLLGKANEMSDRVVDSVMEIISPALDNGTLDCGSLSQHLAFSILGATLFGDGFFVWSKATAYEDLLLRIAKDACFWASYSVPPFWKRGYWKYQRLCTKLKILTQDIVQHCQLNKLLRPSSCRNGSELKEGDSSSNINSTKGMEQLETLISQETCCPLNLREDSCSNIMGMMFHGCLTTAGLISNILARLAMHPEIQEQIYLEVIMVRRQTAKRIELDVRNMHLLLATVYESARLLPAGPLLQRCSIQKIYLEVIMVRRQTAKRIELDVRNMHLLLATVYESARLLPAGPLLQRCSIQKDLQLKNGVLIPAGAVLVAPIQLVQMDEFNWGSDAGLFNPYRFLSKVEKRSVLDTNPEDADAAQGPAKPAEGSYTLNDPCTNAAFLPFGSGLRSCVGQKFAVLGVASIFASLLENYKIQVVPEPDVEPRAQVANCVLQFVPSPKLVFVRRNA